LTHTRRLCAADSFSLITSGHAQTTHSARASDGETELYNAHIPGGIARLADMAHWCGRACSITPVGGEAPTGGRSRSRGRRHGGEVTNVVEAAAHNSSALLLFIPGKRGLQFPASAGFAPAQGGPITLSW
jgi:hypothetical protein